MFNLKFNPHQKIVDVKDLLPTTVLKSDGTSMPFDAGSIMKSIISETGATNATAQDVTTKVIRRIISIGLKTIPAPLIRELVCMELLYDGKKILRDRYTRLGMPLNDIKQLIENKESYKDIKFWLITHTIEQLLHLDGSSEELFNMISALRVEYESYCHRGNEGKIDNPIIEPMKKLIEGMMKNE